MAVSSTRWLGVRTDALISLFIGLVAFGTIFLNPDDGKNTLNKPSFWSGNISAMATSFTQCQTYNQLGLRKVKSNTFSSTMRDPETKRTSALCGPLHLNWSCNTIRSSHFSPLLSLINTYFGLLGRGFRYLVFLESSQCFFPEYNPCKHECCKRNWNADNKRWVITSSLRNYKKRAGGIVVETVKDC